MKAGPNWIETRLVFTTYRSGKGNAIGTGLHPRNVLRTLRRIIAAADANLPQIRVHDLRHSAASLLIAEGVQLAEVSTL